MKRAEGWRPPPCAVLPRPSKWWRGPAHILTYMIDLPLLLHHVTFSRLVVNSSPDSGDIFPLEFLIIEQLLLPKGTSSSTWILKWFVAMTHVGLHDGESHGLWFGLSSKVGDYEKQEQVPTKVSGEQWSKSPV